MYQYIPNLICYARMVLGGVLWWLIMQQHSCAALCVLTVGAVSDFLDGFIARRWRVSSPRGVFLDPLADKILVLLGFLALWQRGLVAWWVVLVIAGRDVVITMLRSLLLARGHQLRTLWLAKSKTVVQFGSLYLFIIGQAAYLGQWFGLGITQRLTVLHVLHVLGVVVAVITALSALLYVPQAFQKRKKV